ncbi:hypothetical protein [Burkholderia ubonensis]|uniref:hypothetical protein n=1 Tax=Burkholderia ubonensis TaxID=101571 RepID=UPI000ABD22D5|nr:hypothetical protein [Burkholderia ubonensis]
MNLSADLKKKKGKCKVNLDSKPPCLNHPYQETDEVVDLTKIIAFFAKESLHFSFIFGGAIINLYLQEC